MQPHQKRTGGSAIRGFAEDNVDLVAVAEAVLEVEVGAEAAKAAVRHDGEAAAERVCLLPVLEKEGL